MFQENGVTIPSDGGQWEGRSTAVIFEILFEFLFLFPGDGGHRISIDIHVRVTVHVCSSPVPPSLLSPPLCGVTARGRL